MDRLHPKAVRETLFLHWGPGSNAYVERQLLGHRYASICFWDQPKIHQSRHAFGCLLDAAVAEAERLAEQAEGTVNLMAHSFGGHLAAGVLAAIPEKIGDCHLFSTGYDVASGFRRLLEIMAADPGTEGHLRNRINGTLQGHRSARPDWAEVWRHIELAFSDPEVLHHYWSRPQQYDAYVTLAACAPPLHLQTFQNVLCSFLGKHFGRSQPIRSDHRILIELGGLDPLFAVADARKGWALQFPTAQFIDRPGSGHFIHLEPYLAVDGALDHSNDDFNSADVEPDT